MALRVIEHPDPGLVPDHPLEMLKSFGGPCVVRLPGQDRTQCRVLVTLLHGNEPSGVVALHRWLRSGRRPAVDIVAAIPSVHAAVADSGFAHRMRPGQPDLNRAFVPPFSGEQGQLARVLLAMIQETGSSTVVDLHNNTGHSPAYGVVSRCDSRHLDLVSLFTARCVVSHLRLGTLVEALDDLTAVTIECGRAGDPQADEVAFAGLSAYFEKPSLHPMAGIGSVRLYEMPLRVRIAADARLAFGRDRVEGADLTLRDDLDQHNFDAVPAGTAIGWSHSLGPLLVTDEAGLDAGSEYFRVEAGVLRVRRTIVPVMMTTSIAAAKQDCLCYFVRESARTLK